jgi:lipoate-protein ligase A
MQFPHVITSSRPDVIPWFLWLDHMPRPGWQNMALDVSLHARAAAGDGAFLRMYRWAPSCLSFGRHEPALRRYDRERITALGLDTVRRPTGGRAVWHSAELTYAVAAPAAAMGSLREAYQRIHGTIATALRMLGAPVSLAPARPAVPLDTGACFSAAAGGEVVLDSSKVAGSAQFRHEGALLQHGSVLLDDDQSLIRDITAGPSEAPDVQPLSRILRRPVEWEEVALAVADAAGAWGGRWTPLGDEDLLLGESERASTQFRDPEWTWRR